jgi:DNA invertase Pin-like site-specific DNA recombinase
MKAVGYVRVSTIEQAKEGVSIDNQIAKIKAYAELNNLELVGIINDAGKSGKTLGREGVQQVISMCKNREISHVIVYKMDRLARSTKDLLNIVEDVFKKYDVQFHSLSEKIDTSSAMGKFFFTITAAMAEMERNQISERTSDALQHLKKQGIRLGAPAMGQTEEEQNTVNYIKDLNTEGLTYQAIADRLNAEGYETKRGGKWYQKTVYNILRRAA